MPLPAGPDILQQMATPTVSQLTTGAGASITYSLVAVNEMGLDGIPSPPFITGANNNATPNNQLFWTAIPGASAYRVLKNGLLLVTVGAGVTTYTDSAGATGSTYVPQTANPAAPVATASFPMDGQKWTYSASVKGVVPGTAATDIFILPGSATKLIRVLCVEIWATTTAATAAAIDILLLKRSTADTGGTTTGSPTPTAHDINAPTSDVVPLIYTSTPPSPLGTLVGTAIRTAKMLPALATYTATDFPSIVPLVWYFGNRPGQGIVLRGITDILAINLAGGTTPTGPLFDMSFEWTAE